MIGIAFSIALASAPASAATAADTRLLPVNRPAPVPTVLPRDVRVAAEPVTVDVEVVAGGERLWAGSLRVGGVIGASFSESKNEYAEPCPDRARREGRHQMSSRNLSFNLNRQPSAEEPDQFGVNVNWSRPVPGCEGNGTNMIGFNRQVTLGSGQSVQLGGDLGLVVRLTRRR